MVSYKVTLDNASGKSIEPGKDNKMCFFLFDKNGKTFMSTGIELEMLKKYNPRDNRTGIGLFFQLKPCRFKYAICPLRHRKRLHKLMTVTLTRSFVCSPHSPSILVISPSHKGRNHVRSCEIRRQ
jgi:hypothetical protein